MSNELWSIYLAGPDDLVAMPSKPVAEAVARNFNAVWDRYGAERGHDVHAVAHVEPWMHGKEAHTKDLREHFYEYADLVLDEDASRFKPAQPVEAVVTEAMVETACRAICKKNGWDPDETVTYSGTRTKARNRDGSLIPQWRMQENDVRTALAAALAHPRPTAARTPCQGCGGARGGLGPNMGYVPCDDCDGVGFIESDEPDTALTGEQAGAMVAEVLESREDDGSMRRFVAFRVPLTDLPVGAYLYAQPRPVGVPDGWKLVPKKADKNMYAAFLRGMAWTNMANSGCTCSDVDHLYAQLLDAAPEVQR